MHAFLQDQNLTCLDLRSNDIGFEGGTALFEVVKKHTVLTEVCIFVLVNVRVHIYVYIYMYIYASDVELVLFEDGMWYVCYCGQLYV